MNRNYVSRRNRTKLVLEILLINTTPIYDGIKRNLLLSTRTSPYGKDNDRAVMQAYGFDIKFTTETSCVAELFKHYQALTQK